MNPLDERYYESEPQMESTSQSKLLTTRTDFEPRFTARRVVD